MDREAVRLLDEPECQELEAFLSDRIYEFNAQVTGYLDGRLIAGSISSDAGEIVAGFSGYTWGGCCEISYLWVHDAHRGQGLGTMLVRAAEVEARRRGCTRVVLMTHSFQAPGFYERLGYQRKYVIEERPMGHSDIIYVRLLDGASEPDRL